MRQVYGRKLVRYTSPGERNRGLSEPSRQSSPKLAAGGCRWDTAYTYIVPQLRRYLHDSRDVLQEPVLPTLALVLRPLDEDVAIASY